MSCACGWDELCSGGAVGRGGDRENSCSLAMTGRGCERSRHIKIVNTRYSIISYRSSFCMASSFPGHAVGEIL